MAERLDFSDGAAALSARPSPASPAIALLAHVVSAGYARCEPSILQPASIFLEQSGENIRSRLFLTGESGAIDLCLRPEYTIPVCRDYLASSSAGKVAAFSYLGPVFRTRANAPGEFVQAGLESFGRTDIEAADAEMLTLSLEAAAAAGRDDLSVRISDAGLYTRFLDALDLPPQWLRRVRDGLARGKSLDAILEPPANGAKADHSGVLAALEGADKKGARALVEDLLSIAGISTVGGRSAGEIAERFLEQAALRSGPAVPADKRALLTKFLAIKGNPDAASASLRSLADEAKLDLNGALDQFDQRLHFLAARGFDVDAAIFSAAFARQLDYYTGFVFEAHTPERPDGPHVISGGRYDRLLKSLGAKTDIPAVGAAIWIERLAAQSVETSR